MLSVKLIKLLYQLNKFALHFYFSISEQLHSLIQVQLLILKHDLTPQFLQSLKTPHAIIL